MRLAQGQRGLTLIGFLIVLVVVAFFGYLAMRVFPVYSEYYSVVSAMKAVQAEPGSAKWTPDQIRNSLDRKFNISYVSSVKPANIKVVRKGGSYNLTIDYEVRDRLVYNLDYVAKFNKTVSLTRQLDVE